MKSTLPASWQLTQIGEIAEIINGRGFKPYEWESKGLPIIRIQNLNGSDEYNYYSGDYNPKILVKNNQLLFAWSGSRGSSFGPHLWDGDDALLNYHTWKIDITGGVDKRYFYFALVQLTARVEDDAHGAAGLVHIQKGWIEKYKIPLPPLPEQKKIAQILSTWDKAIELLEKKIAAKEQLKKALMQQLLTGKKRFKEFGAPAKDGELPEGWREVKLGEVFERNQDKVPEGVEAVLSITSKVGFVDQRAKFSKVIAGKQLEKYVHLKRGEFSYNKGNSKTYPQGCIFRLEEFDEGATPNVYYSFRIKSEEETDSDYCKFYFKAGRLNRQLNRLINSGVRNDGLLNLNAGEFFAVKIVLPPIDEQRKIGRVFDTLEKEIKLISQKLDATKQIKKGLMQQLLTGKVRVKV